MPDHRMVLHSHLESKFPTYKLYFTPPSKTILEYPCIVYKHINLDPTYANNGVYGIGTTFEVVMLRDDVPYVEITKTMLDIPGSRYIRGYMSESIKHDVYEITIH